MKPVVAAAAALLAVAALAFLALPAAAQAAPLDVSFSVESMKTARPPGLYTLNGTVSVGCVRLTANPTGQVEFTFAGVPKGMNITADALKPDPTGCGNGNAATVATVPVHVNIGKTAPANATLVTGMAQLGDATSGASGSTTFKVWAAYNACHSLLPDVTFPVKVSGPKLDFNLTLTYCANARSMIMFDDVKADHGAKLTGLAPTTADPPATVRVPVEFVAPTGAWTTANVTFKNYSHFLSKDGVAGSGMLYQNITWTFTNANPGGAPPGSASSTSKKSPGLEAPVLVAVVLGALVAVARRQR